MKKMLLLLGILGLPRSVGAQVAITEIMYDLEGSDTNREWVEIQNTSSSDLDFSLWRFSEGEGNHKVVVAQGSAILPPGGFAILVDKLESFKIDWPQFGGTIFDSSFFLKNTGGVLVLRDGDLKDVDSVSYTSDLGGAGDGKSLQKINGVWNAGAPTPGAENVHAPAPALSPLPPNQSGTPPSSPPTPTPPNGGSLVPPPIPKSIRASIDAQNSVVVGGKAHFRGSAFGFENKPLENVRFMWNFGDGTIAEGEHVLHTYLFPGKYAVVLSVASGEFSATAQVVIEAVAAEVRLVRAVRDGAQAFVAYNKRAENLDLSGWRLVVGDQSFTLPEHTIVLSQSSATFSQETTNLAPAGRFSLLYPNGAVASVGEEERTETVDPKIVEIVSNPREEASVMKNEPAPKKSAVGVKKKRAFPLPVVPREEITSTTTTEVPRSAENLPAAASLSVQRTIWKWVAALVVLIAGGAVAAVILRKKENDTITLVD